MSRINQFQLEIFEDSFDEIIRAGGQVTSVITWTDSGKTQKIRENNMTYTGAFVDTSAILRYDSQGVLQETQTETMNRTGNVVTSIDRVIS